MVITEKKLSKVSRRRTTHWPDDVIMSAVLVKSKKVVLPVAVTILMVFMTAILVSLFSGSLPLWFYFICVSIILVGVVFSVRAVKISSSDFNYLNTAVNLWETFTVPHVSEKLPMLLKEDAKQQLKCLTATFNRIHEGRKNGFVAPEVLRDAELVLVSVRKFLDVVERAYYISLNDEKNLREQLTVSPKTSRILASFVNQINSQRIQMKHYVSSSGSHEDMTYYVELSQSITKDAEGL